MRMLNESADELAGKTAQWGVERVDKAMAPILRRLESLHGALAELEEPEDPHAAAVDAAAAWDDAAARGDLDTLRAMTRRAFPRLTMRAGSRYGDHSPGALRLGRPGRRRAAAAEPARRAVVRAAPGRAGRRHRPRVDRRNRDEHDLGVQATQGARCGGQSEQDKPAGPVADHRPGGVNYRSLRAAHRSPCVGDHLAQRVDLLVGQRRQFQHGRPYCLPFLIRQHPCGSCRRASPPLG